TEPLTQRLRYPAQVRHGDREDDHRIGLLVLDEALQMALPARSDPAGDGLARDLVEPRLLGARLRAAQVAIALHPREHVANRLSTAGIVLTMIEMSSQIDQFSR